MLCTVIETIADMNEVGIPIATTAAQREALELGQAVRWTDGSVTPSRFPNGEIRELKAGELI